MTVEVKVPRLAESISEAVLAEWLKQDGASVAADEAILTLETDKAAVEIASPENGVLHHAKKAGDRVVVGDVLAHVDASKVDGGSRAAASGDGAKTATAEKPKPRTEPPPSPSRAPAAATPPAPAAPPKAPTPAAPVSRETSAPPASRSPALAREPTMGPAVKKLVEEHGLKPEEIEATGPGGRLLKEDVMKYLDRREPAPARETPAERDEESRAEETPATRPPSPARVVPPGGPASEDERVVPMSRIRQRIAERLVRAQHTAAILTTFNEIDMTGVLELRARHRESFEKRHGVKLGFMSFFTRACVLALEEIPELNAEIRGTDIVYRRRVNMGIAVGTERGLVVPVVRDADGLGFAGIEREIARLSERARAGTLTLDELSGGTFTISNGGVYGSLLSTPILNPPQSGILGMHKIEKRPIAVDGAVVIRPMMYVALSYDHRIVDGEQAVTFLVHVKQRLEDPDRMMLEV